MERTASSFLPWPAQSASQSSEKNYLVFFLYNRLSLSLHLSHLPGQQKEAFKLSDERCRYTHGAAQYRNGGAPCQFG